MYTTYKDPPRSFSRRCKRFNYIFQIQRSSSFYFYFFPCYSLMTRPWGRPPRLQCSALQRALPTDVTSLVGGDCCQANMGSVCRSTYGASSGPAMPCFSMRQGCIWFMGIARTRTNRVRVWCRLREGSSGTSILL